MGHYKKYTPESQAGLKNSTLSNICFIVNQYLELQLILS